MAKNFSETFNNLVGAEDTKSKKATTGTTTTEDTQDIKKEYYRLNLKLDIELKDFLADEAWKQRKSITQLLNEIITEYKNKQ